MPCKCSYWPSVLAKFIFLFVLTINSLNLPKVSIKMSLISCLILRLLSLLHLDGIPRTI